MSELRKDTDKASFKIPLVLVPMLRVGMQGVALRADILKAKFVRQISVPQLMDAPEQVSSFCLGDFQK
ncbi:MAG: hypothetical protein GY749_16620 [Desulfobacteraceae bacterium]|nr:hypothetical protein [Desulfobacteraceae bacterium]